MADVHTKEIRSKNSLSRFSGWQPLKQEYKARMLVRRFLHANGFRFKLHDKSLPGKPDIACLAVRQVLSKYRTAIFVHACPPWRGCFWHEHEGWKYYVVPKTRIE